MWNNDRTKMTFLLSFQFATRLNSHNTNETEFINELWFINFFYIVNSNLHNWSFESTELTFSTLLRFFPRLLTSKHLKIFSTFLVGRNLAIWKTCFSVPQNAKKKENHLKHKTKWVTDFLLTVRSSSMYNYTCHYEVST